MSNSRLPISISGLSEYIHETTNYIQEGEPSNADRLLFTPDEKAFWIDFDARWNTQFLKYSDKTNSRTQAVIDNIHDLRDEFKGFIKSSQILNRIKSAPNISSIDLEVFNVHPSNSASTGGTAAAIEERINPVITSLGGAVLKIKCYDETSTHCRILKGANVIEYRYCIGCDKPENADDASLSYGLSSKATFQLRLPLDAAHKEVHIYFRWNNTHHQDNAGPWSPCVAQVIV